MTPDQVEKALLPYHWPAEAVDAVAKVVTGVGFRGILTAAQAREIVALTGLGQQQTMVALTAVAALYAVPPISNFYVGAVACGASGAWYFGCNMEYATNPLSFCSHGEQGATTNAWLAGETSLTALAVNAAPCGYCRQFLYETTSGGKLQVFVGTSAMPLSDLLPLAFGPQDLGVKGGLLDPQSHNLDVEADDATVRAALRAANMSYAPYTNSYSGIGLRMSDGTTFSGPLAENAAYNPSQSPLEAALFLANIAGYAFTDITGVALVEVASPQVSQLDASAAVLKSVSDLTIDYVSATVRIDKLP